MNDALQMMINFLFVVAFITALFISLYNNYFAFTDVYQRETTVQVKAITYAEPPRLPDAYDRTSFYCVYDYTADKWTGDNCPFTK
jgi:hypothetical protein